MFVRSYTCFFLIAFTLLYSVFKVLLQYLFLILFFKNYVVILVFERFAFKLVGTMWTSPLVFQVFLFHRTMVGTSGLEPPTSRLSGVRSNHLSYAPISVSTSAVLPFLMSYGGDEEDRTPDPLRARQVLSQLSYTPINILYHVYWFLFKFLKTLFQNLQN